MDVIQLLITLFFIVISLIYINNKKKLMLKINREFKINRQISVIIRNTAPYYLLNKGEIICDDISKIKVRVYKTYLFSGNGCFVINKILSSCKYMETSEVPKQIYLKAKEISF